MNCRRCKSSGPFHKSYLAHSNYLCKKCASRSVKECRLRDPARLIAYRAYNALHCSVPKSFVQNVLQRCHFQSVISGERDPMKLCMIPFYRDIPLQEWHCIIVTRQEARSIRKSKDVIPAHIQQHMYKLRVNQTAT